MMVQESEGDEGLSDQDRGGCGKGGGAEVNRPHDHANVLYVFRASRMIKRNSEARCWEIMERDLERKVTRSVV